MQSLGLRVGAIATVVIAVFFVLGALALERAFQDSASAALRERLLAQAYLLMGAVEVDARGQLSLPERLPEARLMVPGSGLWASIATAPDAVAWRSPSAPESAPAPTIPDAESIALTVFWEANGRSFPLTFSVSEDRSQLRAQIASYRRSFWPYLLLLAVLLLTVQALALHRGLRPLRDVTDELHAVERGDQALLEGSYPRELRGLTENLNALLRRERSQLAHYRDALSDLAHSLKTPLAVLGSALDNEPLERVPLREPLRQMEHIIGYQLQRAITAGRRTLSAPVPLRPLVERLAASLDKVHAQRTIHCRIEVPADLTVRGDEGDLMELLGNVMDNAWKFADSAVCISAGIESGRLLLCIDDDGGGIDAGAHATVLTRGGRLDERAPGQGIGLAIVADIVAAYGGTLDIKKSSLGGARLLLSLPQTGL